MTTSDQLPAATDATAVDAKSPFDNELTTKSAQTLAESDPPTATAVVRPNSSVDLPPGSIVDEIYEIDARLGAGAMGEVYAARHLRLGKRVAIKVISARLSEDAAAIERFAMEARTLAKIQHPAIVAIDHVGELADGRAYFVMEYLRGESLFERLSRGSIPLPEALRILDQMARGLDAAHGEGVTHRDLKPENTFLVHLPGEPSVVKLVDFGLAKLAADAAKIDRRAERTQSGVAIGTPMYMSPEQARGIAVDHRTDVYALGCVAYELVLGSPPFPQAQSAPEMFAAHLHEVPPLPRTIWPEIPPQLDLALFAMVAKDPDHRPTLAQVRSVLAGVRATSSQRAETEIVVPRMRPAVTSSRRLTATAIIAIGLVAMVGGILIGSALTARATTPSIKDAGTPHQVPAPAPSAIVPPAPDAAIVVTPIDVPPAKTPPRAPEPPPHPSPPKPPSSIIPEHVDAGVDLAIEIDAAPPPPTPPPAPPPPPERPRPKKPIDRNQTMNPFAKHKVNP